MTFGPGALSDAELLALVVGTSSRTSGGVLQTCRSLLVRLDGIGGMARCQPGELMSQPGIGEARACALLAVVELCRRLGSVLPRRGDPLLCSEDAYQRVKPLLCLKDQETFVALVLDAKHRLITLRQVALGSATSVEVHPREVFGPSVREAAAAVIVAHNHPSGDPEPSEEDRQLTLRLLKAGELLGIRLIDHLIVGGAGYVSLADRGFL